MSDEKTADARNETGAEKFQRLGNSRLTKALDAVALLESLSVTAAYTYTPQQVETMLSALQEAVDNVEEAFKNGGPVIRTRKFF